MMRRSNSGLVGVGAARLEWSQWAMTATRAVQALSPAALSLRWSNEAKKRSALSFVWPSLLVSSFVSQLPAVVAIGFYKK